MGLFFLFTPREIMAVGKNKGLAKSGKKGVKKKVVDPFTRKDWYDIKAPSVFKVRDVGKTLVNKTQGTKLASDGLKGRVYEVSLADLQNEQDAERSYRKFKLLCEEVQGKSCLTQFYGMNLTTDKLRSMVKKWQTLIEANTDVKTTDGNKLIPDSIARDIEKACQGVYPLHDVHIRKVKVTKRPRFDLTKLLDMHGEGSGKGTVSTDPAT